MFVVEVSTALSIVYTIYKIIDPASTRATLGYLVQLDVWLFLTVLFANFAEALAEARGKAQADTLRKTRQTTPAYRLPPLEGDGDRQTLLGKFAREEDLGLTTVSSTDLRAGDLVVVTVGQLIPVD